jgi:hypothetical protein
LHQALDLPDVMYMRCICYVSFNYHQKRPRIALHRIEWQKSVEYALGTHLLHARRFLMIEHLPEGLDDHGTFVRKHLFQLGELASTMS